MLLPSLDEDKFMIYPKKNKIVIVDDPSGNPGWGGVNRVSKNSNLFLC